MISVGVTRSSTKGVVCNGVETEERDDVPAVPTVPFNENYREFYKSLLALSPDLDTADKYISKFSGISAAETTKETTKDEAVVCYKGKIDFLRKLYPSYQKLAACDPPGADDLEKTKVDYWSLLAPIIGLY